MWFGIVCIQKTVSVRYLLDGYFVTLVSVNWVGRVRTHSKTKAVAGREARLTTTLMNLDSFETVWVVWWIGGEREKT